MALVLWLLLALVPFLLGKGALAILYSKDKGSGRMDAYLTGVPVVIGLAEAAHLAAVLLGWSFSDSVRLFSLLAAGGSLTVLLIILAGWGKRRSSTAYRREHERELVRRRLEASPYTTGQQLLFGAFGLSILLQIVVIVTGDCSHADGDITVETVNSFLATDAVYQVNPLTGMAYTAGIPFRWKLLCLPTLYSSLCSLFGISAEQLVTRMIPVAVLVGGYLAYGLLAGTLFEKKTTHRGIFLLLVSLLLWMGDYMNVMDGFGVMYGGYRGTTIRAMILLPCTIAFCLKKKWKNVLLCIVAEACIMWTFYGLGACFLTAALFLLAGIILRRVEKREGGMS